jgi:hypothetical protein
LKKPGRNWRPSRQQPTGPPAGGRQTQQKQKGKKKKHTEIGDCPFVVFVELFVGCGKGKIGMSATPLMEKK